MVWTRKNSSCSGRHSGKAGPAAIHGAEKADVTGNNLYINIHYRTAVNFGIQR